MSHDEQHGIRALARPDARTPDTLWPELVIAGWERVHNHSVSPDGSQVAFYWDRDGASDLWVLALNGPAFPRRLTLNRTHVNWWEDEPPAWSPNSEWLVFGAYDTEGISNLHIVHSAGGAPRQLTNLSDDAFEPNFSPDGRSIVFSTQQGDASQIAMVPFDGGWVVGLTFGEDECSGPAWSPDGARVLFSASPQHGRRQNDIFAISVSASGQVGPVERLTPDDNVECWWPSFAPDNTRIALLCNRSGYDELWLMMANGERLRPLSQLNHDIEEYAWSPDGRHLIALVNRQACDVLYRIDAISGEAVALPCPPGNYSGLQCVRGSNDIVVCYDAPDLPPALYRVSLDDGRMLRLTNTSAAALDRAEFVTPQHIEYVSADGWSIPALLYLPPSDARSRKRPAIVYPHGGPNVHYDMSWDPVRQYFVSKGYVVICPNFRGSTGYGRLFKEANINNWGVGDLADCLSAADYLATISDVDPARIAIWGQSYGGYLTTLALTKDPKYRFRCGVCLFGDSHLKTSWASGDHSGRLDLEWQMGVPGENSERYEASSPLNFVANMRAPILVLHGEQDQRVAFSESLQLVEALKRTGKTFEFHSYPDEGHGFARASNALNALAHVERFLDWWLM